MKNFYYLLFLTLSVCCYGQSSTSPVNQPIIEEKIDAYLQSYLSMNAWSGVVMIAKGGQPIFQKAYGAADREWNIPNTLDGKFRIASISKVFTEVAILKLVENGALKLADKLSQFIPDYPRGNDITVNHLLHHRAGIPHMNSFPNYNDLIKFPYELTEIINLFKEKPLDFEPDTRYRYSNSGYVLLAYIIEQVSGQSYADFLQTSICQPYLLLQTGIDENSAILPNRVKGYMFDADGQLKNADYVNMDIKIGGGSMYSTSADLLRFVYLLSQGNILGNTLNELPNWSEKEGNSVFLASGRVQGFCHQITHRVTEELSVIVLGNHYANIALPISDDIYKIYTNQSYQIPQNYLAQKQQVPLAQLKKYEGVYDFNFGPVGKVKVKEGHLMYGAPGKAEMDRLIPLGNDQFFYLQNWVLLRFNKKQEESYEQLDWIMGDNVYPATKVK